MDIDFYRILSGFFMDSLWFLWLIPEAPRICIVHARAPKWLLHSDFELYAWTMMAPGVFGEIEWPRIHKGSMSLYGINPSHESVTPLRPVYALYSYMEPSESDSGSQRHQFLEP